MWTFALGMICGIIFGGCTEIAPDGIMDHGIYLSKEECETAVRESMLQKLETMPSTEDVVLTIICGRPKNMA